MQFIPLEEVRRPTLSPDSWALWALGFRPFYWVASVFALLSVGLWSLQFAGWQALLSLPGPLWHAHEMVFGYTLAVVVGFLFTAGRNWSGQPTPTDRPLQALVALWSGTTPDATTMGAVAVLALGVNLAVAWMLYAFREGDANMRSVWLCSRNDAIGNLAVMMAAVGVFGTGSAWPDLVVASLMAALALHGGWSVLRQARGEIDTDKGHDHAH